MLYKVIKNFGPSDPEWPDFANGHWIQPLISFDSIDGMLCPDLFSPVTDDDWMHCVNADYRLSLITDEVYARKVYNRHPESKLVAIVESDNCDGQPGLLGYDILDAYTDVSLITNWDPFASPHPLSGFNVSSNGLIPSFSEACRAREFLRVHFLKDEHAQGATVWAILAVDA